MKHRNARVWEIASVVVLALALFACKMLKKKPEAGKECDSAGAQVCQDPTNTLVCQGGMWRAFACSGPKGCAKTGETSATCDISGNAPGTPCPESAEGSKVCADKRSRMACNGGKLERVDCKGPKGCFTEGTETKCDMSIADIGSACFKADAWACTTDQKSQLLCKNGEWTLNAPCRGAKGCYEKEPNKLWCDQTVAYVGDTCFNEGQEACTHDGKYLLVCKNKKFSIGRRCTASPYCQVKDNKVDCTYWD